MNKLKNNKIVFRIIAASVLISIITTNVYLARSQTTYNEFVLPPDNNGTIPYVGNTPRDIVYADNKIFVYTMKKIIVFNEDKTYQGSIEFGSPTNYGHFALKLSGYGQTAVDFNYMFYTQSDHKLYFLTPNLEIKSIYTNNSTYNPGTELNAPAGIPLNRVKKLYVFNKFEINGDKLIWLIRTKSPNLHSWDSYLGVYYKTNGIFGQAPIYSDFMDGSDETYGYDHTISSFGYYPEDNDIYISRSVVFEVLHINQDNSVTTKATVSTQNQRRFGKFLLIKNLPGSNPKMLALPLQIPYEDPNPTTKIFQFDVNNPSDPVTILAPNSRIMDAEYISTDNELVLCYPNDDFLQIFPPNVPEHDLSIFTFNQNTSEFEFSYAINTTSNDETDINYHMNINTPLALFRKTNGDILLNKKNELIRLFKNNAGQFVFTVLHYSKNACYSKTAETNSNIFVINNLSAGLECFDDNYNWSNIKTSHAVYDIVYNPQKRELYFFNRLGADNTGFYIYDLDNEVVSGFIETDKAIGDLAYNSVLGHVLVSEFNKDEGSGATIRVFDANSSFSELNPLTFAGENYPSEIFCAPNNKIYISVNMLSDDLVPRIEILDATDYSSLASLSSGFVENYGNYENRQQHYSTSMKYCYNPYNKSVYLVVGGNYSYYPPYQIDKNSGYFPFFDANLSVLTSPDDGKLREIKDDNTMSINYKVIPSPGEIICAVPNNPPSKDYMGKLYINGSSLYSYDCGTSLLSASILEDVIDIDYNSNEDCIYAYRYEFVDKPNPTPNEQWIKILKVNSDNSIDQTPLYHELGLASSINYNKYDDQLYIHYISGYRVMGESPIKIIAVDTKTYSISNSFTTNNTSLFPEVVPIADYPFFDPYANKAYFPNGMHSNVSVVDFTAKEALHFTTGTDWLSIPRMNGNVSTAQKEGDPTSDVFDRDNFQAPYTELDPLYHWHAESSSAEPYTSTWHEDVNWAFIPDKDDNKTIYSFRGYQLDVKPDGDNVIYMTGNIKDPLTQLPLFNRKNNWVGYFLPGEQDIFDALGPVTLNNISEITAKDYYCYRSNDPIVEGPIGGSVQGTYWVCDQQQTNIAYGEMVQLLSRTDSDYEFQWQNSGANPREKIRPEPSHFQFNETAAYTPIIIELDYTDNPLEIGAFVNDSCVGAEAVMAGDSLIILRAFLEGASPDSIVFADWFGTKSSGNNFIKGYYVFNESTKTYEKRPLYPSSVKGRAKVSFKDKGFQNDGERPTSLSDLKIWPNPVSDRFAYSFVLSKKSNMSADLYSINGKLLANVLDREYNAGYCSGAIGLKDNKGEGLSPGVYLIVFSANGCKTVKKLIVK
ncbi:MAG: T9SS type A sorting domain-containing protein [Chlorobi bacterium]|nr:T9SS type A sorting domain-containing protein [Chlorobiota bacterium]